MTAPAPLTQAWYDRTTLPKMQLARYVTVREIENGHGVIPVGTTVRITGKRGGLNLEADVCEHCRYRPFVSGVRPGSIGLAP